MTFSNGLDPFTESLISTFSEVHQPRSAFQLEKFVINAHDTDEMRYYQCVTELQALYYTISEVSLQIKKTEIEIARLRQSGDEIDEIEAKIKELGLQQTNIVAVGAFREVEVLLKLIKKYPKYSRTQIEAGQSEYWHKRLTRQTSQQILAGTQSGASHLEAMAQIDAFDLQQAIQIQNEQKEIKE